ncbi:MAG: NAD-dependent deacylase [Deltaproteobacteria bacterium]|nr:NAD-dependent deacylase [Deltaproteobacteria bacterium]
MEKLELDDQTHLLVLTGAGASAESGIPTFRGLTADEDLSESDRERLSTLHGLLDEPARFWRIFSGRRAKLLEARPNAGHRALAAIEEQLGERFLLATQNVDGLHQLAGSKRVLELHGNLLRTRCTRCRRPAFADIRQYERPPVCELCEAEGRANDPHDVPWLRPDVVLFGEHLAPKTLERIEKFVERAARERLVYLAVGTSGLVYPAAELVQQTHRAGAETWLVNLEPAANTESFDHFIQGKSGAILPKLLGVSA